MNREWMVGLVVSREKLQSTWHHFFSSHRNQFRNPMLLLPEFGIPSMRFSLVYTRIILVSALISGMVPLSFGQRTLIVDSSQPGSSVVIAGPEYRASGGKQFRWGSNYRKEWATPITVPLLNLDSAFGGLMPLELGGGRQTKTLHMTDARGRRYVLRTVNKTYSGALPPIVHGTFIERLANDQTSTLHPYAALTVPPMAVAAGVYHALPRLYLVPPSSRLGQFNTIFANQLCMLEERPDESQTARKNFGSPDDIDGSNNMVENVTDDNNFNVDQHFYVKTRLFDMLIGDWGRHIDNWRWAQFDSGENEIYKPVPKDRDQLYARFEGVMMKMVKILGGLKQLQSFGPAIKDITWYNFPAMDIDRRFTNSVSLQTWIDSARALQSYLTDSVIESAVKRLPPEVFPISGPFIIHSIKQRRNDIVTYATRYYHFLAEYVDVPGTKQNEWFDVQRLNDKETSVTVYRLDDDKKPDGHLFQRVFRTAETKELRLYGIGGNDIYTVNGDVKKGITIRIIGGPETDSMYDASRVNGRTRKTKIYDKQNTRLYAAGESKIRIRDTTYIYPFEEDYHYNYASKKVSPGLHPFYRLFIGVAYKKRVYGWREKPYKSDLQTGINFSLFEKSFHPYVRYLRPQLFGSWNVHLNAGYDGARRLNYFGLGNETGVISEQRRYHWLRTENFYAATGINTPVFDNHHIYLTLFYDGVKVLPEEGRFVSKGNPAIDPATFRWKHFGGARFDYTYSRLNDPLVPTRGISYAAGLSYTGNLQEKSRAFTTATALIDYYQPLSKFFSLYVRSGGATVWGKPEFYQFNTIGSGITVRGYVRNRFLGKTIYYQQNELRFIRDVRSYLFNGKAGLIALCDVGRLWHPGEESNRWHYGIGGGFLIAPFNKFSARVYYTRSRQDGLLNLRIGRFF